MSATPPAIVKERKPRETAQASWLLGPDEHSREHSRRPSRDTINETSSVATFDVYESTETTAGYNEVTLDTNDIYNYVDDLQSSANASAGASTAASAVDPASLAFNLRTKASLTSSVSADRRSLKPSSSVQSDLRSRPPSASGRRHDAQDILRLMRETRGLMHGAFRFRLAPSQPWSATTGFIAPQVGSLLHTVGAKAIVECLVQDLSACRVTAVTDMAAQETFLRLSIPNTRKELHMLPQEPAYFNAWFAACLCWRPMSAHRRPNSASPSVRPQVMTGYPAPTTTSIGTSSWRDNRALRGEDAILLEPSYTPTAASIDDSNPDHVASTPRVPRDVKRIKVSCILRGSGHLSLHVGAEANNVANVQVKDLPRSAIQRVNLSIFHTNLVLAIRPRYSSVPESGSRLSPLYILFHTRESLETWYVLLQTIASPELYGPRSRHSNDWYSLDDGMSDSQPDIRSMVRIQHSLSVRVNRLRLTQPNKRMSKPLDGLPRQESRMSMPRPSNYYVEILLDDQLHVVTAGKQMNSDALHVYETHNLQDVPSQLSTVGARVRRHGPATAPADFRRSWTHLGSDSDLSGKPSEPYIEDEICGETVIELPKIDDWSGTERNLPLLNDVGVEVGEISLMIDHEREVIMIESEYDRIVDSFEKLAVPITTAFSEQAGSSELPKLAERLLNICQLCGNVQDWLMTLAEREVNSITLVGSPDVESSPSSRESDISRPMRSSITAVTLFRGNTLLTKALDLYMKRVGATYLEETLGRKMREVAIYEPDCEVDPNKVLEGANKERNWTRLMDVTKETWQAIYRSAEQCPMELRIIFRHIRRCAARRFSKSNAPVKYTSVSAFIFLRFFCAATLNPHLFGLIDDDTSVTAPRAHRAFTLIAKSLQGLANMTNFGNKEPWMAPMNDFCTAHREELQHFLDSICNVDEDWVPPNVMENNLIAHSSTRTQYMRLPPAAREGIPSLPHLFDRTRDVAALVRMWVERAPEENKRLSNTSTSTTSGGSTTSIGLDIPSFHAACVRLHGKTEEYLAQVDMEEADDIPDAVTTKWASIAERMETRPDDFWITGIPAALYGPPPAGQIATSSKRHLFRKNDKEKDSQRPVSKAPSQMSSGSEKSAEVEKEKKKRRKKSPPRNAQENAMRKLGWM